MILEHTLPTIIIKCFNNTLASTPYVAYYQFLSHDLSMIKDAVKNGNPFMGMMIDDDGTIKSIDETVVGYIKEMDALAIGTSLLFINNFPKSGDKVLPIQISTTVNEERRKELLTVVHSNPLIYGKPYEVELPEWVRECKRVRISEDRSMEEGTWPCAYDITSSCYHRDASFIKIDNPKGGLKIEINPPLT